MSLHTLRYLAGRILSGAALIVALTIFAFLMIRLLPGSVEDVLLGTESPSEEAVEAVRERYGLDEPLHIQYLSWVRGVARGEFGESPRTRQEIWPELQSKSLTSLQLGLAAVLVALVSGLALGTLAGLRRGSVWDRSSTAMALLGSSVPDFVVGLLLIITLARTVDFLPTSGFVPLSSGMWDWLRHLLLPVAALALILMGVLTRLTRGAVAETMGREHVRTARGKGLSPIRVILQHVLRPSLLTVTSTVGVQLVAVLGGVVVIEVVFSIPGLGRLILDAIRNRDYVTVQGATLLLGTWAIAVSVLTDVMYGVVDPRVRERA